MNCESLQSSGGSRTCKQGQGRASHAPLQKIFDFESQIVKF